MAKMYKMCPSATRPYGDGDGDDNDGDGGGGGGGGGGGDGELNAVVLFNILRVIKVMFRSKKKIVYTAGTEEGPSFSTTPDTDEGTLLSCI